MARSTDRYDQQGYEESSMANTPSADTCSELIERLAIEYENSFCKTSSSVELDEDDQIPPDVMKKFVNDYRKWFETTASEKEKKVKLSALKSILESWKLKVDTISKLIICMKSTLSVLVLILIFGCQSGLYQIDAANQAGDKDGSLSYKVVDRLDPESYSEECLPIEVSVTKSHGNDNSEGLCVLTLGIIPAFYDEFETIKVTVKSPIGEKSGTGSVHAKKWLGWICLIPYPGFADVRCDRPKLPNSDLEEKAKAQIVESLVSQFPKSEYVALVRKLKEDKAREQRRVEQKKEMIEALVKDGRYEDAIKACDNERKTSGKDVPWIEIREQASKSLLKAVSTINDVERLIVLFSTVKDCETKDEIVIRLHALDKAASLGVAALVKYVDESYSEKGRLCAISAITDEKELVRIATSGYIEPVTLAAFKKIGNPDAVRDVVWSKASDIDLIKAYISVFGTEEELSQIVKNHAKSLTSQIVALIKEKQISGKLAQALDKILAKEKAGQIAISNIQIKKGSYTGSLFAHDYTYVSPDWEGIVSELKKIDDSQVRADVALNIALLMLKMNRKMFTNGESSRSGRISTYQDRGDMEKSVNEFFSMMTSSDCNELFASFAIEGENSKLSGYLFQNQCFFRACFSRMTKEAKDAFVADVMSRYKEEARIGFSGFYVGMPYKDYMILSLCKDVVPHWSDKGSITFDREDRYKLFEKEDGEFWGAYLRKFVPADRKKSLSESLDEALDGSSFKYQREIRDSGICLVYKSMKYRTQVVFDEKSGKLTLGAFK